MSEKILSVGIDIGTTTTQLIFSRLTIENTASEFSVPDIKIVNKEIIYKSEIYETPLISPVEIDVNKLKNIIAREYNNASIQRNEISTGAVIITGETARKDNADQVLSTLSDYSGDFVVATAGPELESILAGRGAGADVLSKEHTTVANIDIGGGTTNISIFKNGELIDTSCLNVGGRLIEIETETQNVLSVSKSLQPLLEEIELEINIGDKAPLEDLNVVANYMADAIGQAVNKREETSILDLLTTNKKLDHTYNIDKIMFSGGVADIISNYHFTDNFEYGDIGPLVAKSIINTEWYVSSNIVTAQETIRATVIGAGSHTVTISGSTIFYSDVTFPIKNLPVIDIDVSGKKLNSNELTETIQNKTGWFNYAGEQELLALSIKGQRDYSYTEVEQLAKIIIKGLNIFIDSEAPLIIIVEKDIGKVLGLMLNKYLESKKGIICIDSVKVRDGDYVDIGTPLSNGIIIPIVIKTLALGY